MTRPPGKGSVREGVTYTLRAFKRGFQSGRQPLQLETQDDLGTALTAFRETLAECRPHWEESAGSGAAQPWVSDAIAAPRGPICRFGASEPMNSLEPVLDDIATGLTRRGIGGTLRPATVKLHPVFAGGKPNSHFVTLSANLVLPVDLERLYADTDSYGRPHYGWLVDPELTRDVLRTAIDWCLGIDGDTYLSGVIQTTPVTPHTDDILAFLLNGPSTPGGLPYMFGVKRASRHRMRFVASDRYGLVTLQELDTRTDQQPALDDLMTITKTVAPHTWATSVRESATGITGWSYQPAQANHRSPIDASGGIDWWQVLHLLPHHVLDAHVHQVLTDSQLAKTNLPPERWTSTPLGNGRHAVTAVDPEPWLDHSDHTRPISADNRPTGVDPAALDQARRDFGAAIITPRTLDDHPPPMPNNLYARYREHHPSGSRGA